jgi:hypothetical protein
MSEKTKTKEEIKQGIEQAVQDFTKENPELAEALEVFSIATVEYERALRALYPSVTYTGSSTQSSR